MICVLPRKVAANVRSAFSTIGMIIFPVMSPPNMIRVRLVDLGGVYELHEANLGTVDI